MLRTRIGLLGVGLLIAFTGQASAQRPEAQPRQPGGDFRRGQIITPDEMTKLELSAEQKEKIEKIVKDYTDATRDLGFGGGAGGNFQEIIEKRNKARTEATDKVKAVLKDDQKKKFDELVQQRPRTGGTFPGGGFGVGGANLGKVLPEQTQTRLEMTSEQKEQLEKLQKKVDEELKKILTEAQQKQFEEMKTARPGGVRPGGGGGDRPTRPGNRQPSERPGRDARPARPANP